MSPANEITSGVRRMNEITAALSRMNVDQFVAAMASIGRALRTVGALRRASIALTPNPRDVRIARRARRRALRARYDIPGATR